MRQAFWVLATYAVACVCVCSFAWLLNLPEKTNPLLFLGSVALLCGAGFYVVRRCLAKVGEG